MIDHISARNILLYTLIAHDDFQSKHHCVWNIFYHLFLDDTSFSLLISQSKALAELSKDLETWRAGPYSSFIEIGTTFTLRELHRRWKWYAETAAVSAEQKKLLRHTFMSKLKKCSKEFRGYVFTLSARSTGPMWPNAAVVMNEAHHLYWETGVAATGPEDVRAAIHPNPAFSYSNGQEVIGYQHHSPYTSFLLAALFNPLEGAELDRLPKPTVQDVNRAARAQFFTWCQTFQRYARAEKVKLRMIVSDALALCRTLQEYTQYGRHTAQCRVSPWRAPMLVLDGDGYAGSFDSNPAPTTFDVIDTSNLWDHVGILNILVATSTLR